MHYRDTGPLLNLGPFGPITIDCLCFINVMKHKFYSTQIPMYNISTANSFLLFVYSGQVEYAKFNETWKAVAKEFGCEERVQTVFDLFASLSGKDDTSVIGKEDLDALMDLLAGVGKRQIPLNSCIHSDSPERA